MNIIFIQKTLHNHIAGVILVPIEIYSTIHTDFNGMIRTTADKHLSSVL